MRKRVAAFTIIMAWAYLATAFVSLTWNPLAWAEGTRFFAGVCAPFIALWVAACPFLFED